MGSGCSSSGSGSKNHVLLRQIALRLGSDFPARLKTADDANQQLKVVNGIVGDARQLAEAGFHTHLKKREQERFAASSSASSARSSVRVSRAADSASEVDATPSTPAPAAKRDAALSSPLLFENSDAFSLMGGRHRLVLEDICHLKENDQVLIVVSESASPVKYDEFLRAVDDDSALFRRAGDSLVQRPATIVRNPKGCDFLLAAAGERESVEGLYNHTIGLVLQVDDEKAAFELPVLQIFEGKVELWELTRVSYARPPVDYYRLLGQGKVGWSRLPSYTPVVRQLLAEVYGDATATFRVLEVWSRVKSTASANKARDDRKVLDMIAKDDMCEKLNLWIKTAYV